MARATGARSAQPWLDAWIDAIASPGGLADRHGVGRRVTGRGRAVRNEGDDLATPTDRCSLFGGRLRR